LERAPGGRGGRRPSEAGLGSRGAGRAPALAVAVERAGWRPRPAAPLPPPAHSAAAKGGRHGDADTRRPESDDARPATDARSEPAAPHGRPAGKRAQAGAGAPVWGSPRAGPG
jgi:hypothetical protein